MGRFPPATGTLVKAIGPVMWSLMMPLFQGPQTEEGLAATATAGEAEVTTSTARETEVTVSTAGEAEVIVSPIGEAEVIVSPTGEAEASSVPTEVPALSMTTEDPGEGVTPVSVSECMFHFTSFREIGGCLRWEQTLAFLICLLNAERQPCGAKSKQTLIWRLKLLLTHSASVCGMLHCAKHHVNRIDQFLGTEGGRCNSRSMRGLW